MNMSLRNSTAKEERYTGTLSARYHDDTIAVRIMDRSSMHVCDGVSKNRQRAIAAP